MTLRVNIFSKSLNASKRWHVSFFVSKIRSIACLAVKCSFALLSHPSGEVPGKARILLYTESACARFALSLSCCF